jgi:hypothetical protein
MVKFFNIAFDKKVSGMMIVKIFKQDSSRLTVSILDLNNGKKESVPMEPWVPGQHLEKDPPCISKPAFRQIKTRLVQQKPLIPGVDPESSIQHFLGRWIVTLTKIKICEIIPENGLGRISPGPFKKSRTGQIEMV